ncbi:MAG: hypothetical protein QM770_07785 [Tepidisphaeraceae bacterium]
MSTDGAEETAFTARNENGRGFTVTRGLNGAPGLRRLINPSNLLSAAIYAGPIRYPDGSSRVRVVRLIPNGTTSLSFEVSDLLPPSGLGPPSVGSTRQLSTTLWFKSSIYVSGAYFLSDSDTNPRFWACIDGVWSLHEIQLDDAGQVTIAEGPIPESFRPATQPTHAP